MWSGSNIERRLQALRRAERLLSLAGLAVLSVAGFYYARAGLYQRHERQALERRRSAAKAEPAKPAAPRASLPARLEIPRLGLSVMVLEGTDEKTLRLAAGHIAGTAMPGASGNAGIAGHRDTCFRPLRFIRKGDLIRIGTADSTYCYRVESATIVRPEDTWVLRPSPQPTLTLVTCYPFYYVGAAPQRFIVRAAAE